MPSLRGKRVLVTGAAGFIGSHLVRRLIGEQAQVHALASPKGDLHRLQEIISKISVLRADVRDGSALRTSVQKAKPHLIFHLADYGIHPGQRDMLPTISTNVLGMSSLLAALQEADFDCLVTTGTAAEYGAKSRAMLEDDVLEPDTLYGASKAAGTLLAQAFGKMHKKRVVTLRLFHVFGPGEDPMRFIPTALRCCLEGSELKLTSRREKRDLVFVQDVVEAYLLAASCEKAGGRILNIGSSKETRLGEIIRCIERCAGKKIKLSEGAYEDRPWKSPCWAANIGQARHVLGWQPSHDLAAGIRKTFDALHASHAMRHASI